MDKILVGIGGAISIIFVIWFFFGKKKKVRMVLSRDSVQEVDIIVDGGYNPDTIEVKKGMEVKINFNRKDPSDCLEEVVLGDFGIRQKLALNKVTSIEFTPKKSGEFDFSCGMGMFHGKIIVK